MNGWMDHRLWQTVLSGQKPHHQDGEDDLYNRIIDDHPHVMCSNTWNIFWCTVPFLGASHIDRTGPHLANFYGPLGTHHDPTAEVMSSLVEPKNHPIESWKVESEKSTSIFWIHFFLIFQGGEFPGVFIEVFGQPLFFKQIRFISGKVTNSQAFGVRTSWSQRFRNIFGVFFVFDLFPRGKRMKTRKYILGQSLVVPYTLSPFEFSGVLNITHKQFNL